MNPRLPILVLLICAIVGTLATANAGEETNRVSKANSDWIYFRHQEIYTYLLRFADISEKERQLFRKKAYEFFFEYWVLHKSKYAQLHPVADFEHGFALLLRNHAIPSLDADDPLDIKSRYKDGKFVPKPLPTVGGVKLVVPETERLPHVEGLPAERLKSWATYQEYVRQFKDFIESSVRKSTESGSDPTG